MRTQTHAATLLLATIALLSIAQSPAHAQGGPDLWSLFAERLDERQLERDQARLQRDISRGNTDRVNRDRERIQMDQWWLTIDRQGGVTNAPLPQMGPAGAALIPHPQYPGYGYYPADPNQLYQLPQPDSPGNPSPDGSASTNGANRPTTGALTAPVRAFALIVNLPQTDSAVNYVVDRVTYRTESGRVQRLAVGPSSTIVFDRGGDFGTQRYSLPAGVYEFRSSDAGWALFKVDTKPQEDASDALPALAPRQNAPASTPAPKAGAPAATTGPQR